MSTTIDDVKANLSGQIHGADADTLDDIELMFERSANRMLARIDPIETERTLPLAAVVHDDFYNYALPSDYKKVIDIIPEGDRQSWDRAVRNRAGEFDLKKAIANKVISIEGSEGSKIIRINWKSRKGKVLNTCDSLTANGTWAIVGSATGLVADTITKFSGRGSLRFNVPTTGGGIKNTTMTALDFTDEDEVAESFYAVFLGSDYANLTSITPVWGNDLTTAFWTGVAQTTQADGTAFKYGWNVIKCPWGTATETGSVDPAAIDSCQLTFQTTGALANVRVDNIIFSIGRTFDIKYYSKYILKNSAGTWIRRTTVDSDTCVLDTDAIEIYNLENLISASQQQHNDAFDISFARIQLNGDQSSPDPIECRGLYAKYRGEYPSQSKKAISRYTGLPRLSRGAGNSSRNRP